MRTLFSCHSLLLCPLLLATLLAHTQQPRQDTLQPRQDTLLLHFPVDRFDIQPADAAQAARFFHDTTFGAKNIDSILITGYTDKHGTLAHNQRLSAQRAAAAGDWLQAQLGYHSSPDGRLPSPDGRLPSPDGRLPSPDGRFPSPDGRFPSPDGRFPSPRSAGDTLRWHLTPGGIAPTPERTDSDNRRAEIIIHYHPHYPEAMPPADTATALHRDSTQPTAVISLPINFIVDTPIPTDSTRLTLPGYVATLRKYADRRMEIDGFCNSIVPLHGPDDPLFKLSVNRAKFIYNYLVDAGFDPAKLTYKGMGNASPVNPDPVTRKEMDANMRVEIKIF